MKRLIFIATIIATPVLAQQSPAEQVLSTKLLQELQASLSCSTDAIILKADLAKAQARIKELEAKEVKPDAQQIPGTGQNNGSSGSQPGVR